MQTLTTFGEIPAIAIPADFGTQLVGGISSGFSSALPVVIPVLVAVVGVSIVMGFIKFGTRKASHIAH